MTNIKSCQLLESSNQNKYFYDRNINKTHLCHPLLQYIIELDNEGIDVKQWLDNPGNDSIEIKNYGCFSRNEIEYYCRKYFLLKENGYFSHIDQEGRLGARLDEEIVKSILANTEQLTFEVTDNCNLNCDYCGYGKFYCSYDKREKKNMDTGTAKRVINYLLELWNSSLNRSHDNYILISFYGGEPLMNFDFIEEIVGYVNHLNARYNRFAFSMTTNGILLQKYMDFLYENNFLLLVSLDGNEDNNGYRVFKNGKPAYKTIVKNVNALREAYPDYFSKNVEFNTVLHNKNSVSEVYNYFKEHFGKSPSISELNTSGVEDSLKEEFWQTYSNVYESLYQNEDYSLIEKEMFTRVPTVKDVSRFIHSYSDFSFNNYYDLIYSNEFKNRVPTGTCTPFSKKIFLTVNGKILPCERIGYQYSLGHATPDKVVLNYKEIAEKYNAYFDKILKKCRFCRNTETCIQCMFHLNIDDENPVCKGFMTDKDFSRHISSLISHIEKDPGVYSKILKEVVID